MGDVASGARLGNAFQLAEHINWSMSKQLWHAMHVLHNQSSDYSATLTETSCKGLQHICACLY